MNKQITDGPTLDNDSGEEVALQLVTNTALQATVSAEISQQVATARAYPRRADPVIAREIVGRATLNEEIAAECRYSLSRSSGAGGSSKAIEGPSVRFAEIVVASYGNLRIASRFVRLDLDDPERGAVIVEAIAHDMQNNIAVSAQVRRGVMTSGTGGKKPRLFSADMINMTVNAAASIAFRNAALKVVPKALWIDAAFAVVSVVRGTQDTLIERRNKVIAEFGKLKVEAEAVCAALGVKEPGEITLEHMPDLIGMWTAIKDGESIDMVLGRMREANAPHQHVQNPMRDEPADTGKPAGQGAAAPAQGAKQADAGEAAQRPAQGQQEAAKQKVEFSTGTQPTAEKRAQMQQQPATDAKAAKAAAEFANAGDYLSYMNEFIGTNGNKPALIKDEWGRTRQARRDLLDAKQLEALNEAYNEALAPAED